MTSFIFLSNSFSTTFEIFMPVNFFTMAGDLIRNSTFNLINMQNAVVPPQADSAKGWYYLENIYTCNVVNLSLQLSNPKHLRGGVRFVKEIPRNPTGKILRRTLRMMIGKPGGQKKWPIFMSKLFVLSYFEIENKWIIKTSHWIGKCIIGLGIIMEVKLFIGVTLKSRCFV